MSSRHGTDALYFFMLATLVALLVLNLFLDNMIISVLAIVLLVFTVFRAFSKDKKKRQAENMFFLVLLGKVKAPIILLYNKHKFRNEYEFVRCKKCRGIVAIRLADDEPKAICPRCKAEVFKEKKK